MTVAKSIIATIICIAAAALPAAARAASQSTPVGITIRSTDVGICAAAPATGGPLFSSCPAGTPAAEQTWQISGNHFSSSGFCLSATRTGPRTVACAPVPRQRWTVITHRPLYHSVSLRNQRTRQCLMIPAVTGGPFRMRKCLTHASPRWGDQEWFLEP